MCFANKERLFTRMSRSKSRLQADICGDCGASDPSWASVNRGILLCAECASVHRQSLGRHLSQVKSLRQGTWSPSVLNFVNSLNAHGANSVWEHSLPDLTGKNNCKKKPSPKDPLHPVKSDFIRAKHVNLAFVLKPNIQEEGVLTNNLENELSKQLHASVRTSNLETSLRLLVQGADPNYFHEDKRSTPLHVAAKFGQSSQIELLIAFGAELNVVDGDGLTPIEVAKNKNHNLIAERLIEAMYEVTDRITAFLGGKKPDHAAGKHIVIPDQGNIEISEQLKIARGKLQLVPNKMFEELVMDLYDEVDRRENEAIWATSALNPEIGAVPFLPANPYLSATRNQGRQKLARFSPLEFAGLLTDVLIDARRRQNMANLRPIDAPAVANLKREQRDSNLSDDEPLYDAVASDDDYAALAPIAQQALVNQSPVVKTSNAEVEVLRKQLIEYMSEINQLKTVVQKLSTENSELKSKFSESSIKSGSSYNNIYDVPLRIDLNGTETETEPVLDGSSSSNQSTIKRPVSMYETRLGSFSKTTPECRTTASMYQMAADKSGEFSQPLGEEVRHRTDLVTRRLKELCLAMQVQDTAGTDAFVPCAERIRVAVAELTAIFATPNHNEKIRSAIKQLNLYTGLMQRECENLQKSISSEDGAAIDAFMTEVRDCAFHIANATKTLVMEFQ